MRFSPRATGWTAGKSPLIDLGRPPKSLVFSGAGFFRGWFFQGLIFQGLIFQGLIFQGLVFRGDRSAAFCAGAHVQAPPAQSSAKSGSAGLPWPWKKSFLTFSNLETPSKADVSGVFGRRTHRLGAPRPAGVALDRRCGGRVGTVLPFLTVSLPAPAGKIISAAVSLPHTTDGSNLWAGARAVEGAAQTLACAGGLRTSGGRISLQGGPSCFES